MYKIKIAEYHYHGGLNKESFHALESINKVFKKILEYTPDYKLIGMYGILVYVNDKLIYNTFLDKKVSLIELAERIEKGVNQ